MDRDYQIVRLYNYGFLDLVCRGIAHADVGDYGDLLRKDI